jgi:hypothetical protein
MGRLITIGSRPTKTLFSDTFSRADNATTLGNAEVGGAWTAQNGTWGVTGGEGYCVSDVDGNILVGNIGLNLKSYTFTVSIKGTISGASNQRRLNPIFKYIDSTNFWYVSFSAGTLSLRKVDTDNFTTQSSISLTTLDDVYYKIKVVCSGSNIQVYVDGILRISYVMTSLEIAKYGTATGVGFRYNKTGTPTFNARFDNLSVTTVVGASAPNVTKYLSDTFTRADSTTTMGVTETGQTWSPAVSTWGISSGKAYCAGDLAGALTLVDSGVSNYRLTCTINGSYSNPSNRALPIILVRGTDNSNYIQVMFATRVDIMKVDAGAFTGLANSTNFSFTDGTDYTITITCVDSVISVYINGALLLTHILSAANAKYIPYTKVGLRYDKTGVGAFPARWDNLVVDSI